MALFNVLTARPSPASQENGGPFPEGTGWFLLQQPLGTSSYFPTRQTQEQSRPLIPGRPYLLQFANPFSLLDFTEETQEHQS